MLPPTCLGYRLIDLEENSKYMRATRHALHTLTSARTYDDKEIVEVDMLRHVLSPDQYDTMKRRME